MKHTVVQIAGGQHLCQRCVEFGVSARVEFGVVEIMGLDLEGVHERPRTGMKMVSQNSNPNRALKKPVFDMKGVGSHSSERCGRPAAQWSDGYPESG
ncbi:MAG: hypothetical protein IPM37_22920 [Hahellaceae bacterium]|nr:hypothetical protein [Hahellaceae bacterium]